MNRRMRRARLVIIAVVVSAAFVAVWWLAVRRTGLVLRPLPLLLPFALAPVFNLGRYNPQFRADLTAPLLVALAFFTFHLIQWCTILVTAAPRIAPGRTVSLTELAPVFHLGHYFSELCNPFDWLFLFVALIIAWYLPRDRA